MVKETKKMQSVPVKWKNLAIGIFLTLTTNVVFLSNMFAVGKFQLSAGELCFIKGIIQTLIFGLAYLTLLLKPVLWKKTSSNLSEENNFVPKGEALQAPVWKPTFIVVAYGLTNALTTILAYIALKLIPLSDIVVFGHTTPIFTLLLSAVFLRTRISIYNASFCFLVLVGVVLVAKPTFIFGSTDLMSTLNIDDAYNSSHHSDSAWNGTDYEVNEMPTKSESSSNYVIGTLLVLAAALLAAVNHVVSAKVLKYNCTNIHLMISAGIATIITSGFTPLVGMDNRFFNAIKVEEIYFYPDLILLIAIGLGSILGGLMLVFANQKCPPTVVSIVRSSEILLALFIDRVILGIDGHGYFALAGSILVLLSVMGMASSSWIENQFKCKEKDLKSDDEELEENTIALISEKTVV